MTVHELLNALAEHRGRERGISAQDLARQLRISRRTLRKLITTARREGTAICGRPSTGYFVAVTAEELADSCLFLTNRARHSLKLASVMTGISIPTLMGQLFLNQG